MTAELTVGQVAERSQAILDEVERAVVGKRPVLELRAARRAGRRPRAARGLPGPREDAHRPLVRAASSASSSRRVQFTPDLMPADITGSLDLRPAPREFEFRPGPVFTNLLLGDEINRAPPKTQAALLEAMQERQVTARARRAGCRGRSSSSPPRTPSSTRAPTRCPRRSSTASCCAPSVGYPAARRRVGDARRSGSSDGSDDVELRPVVDAAELLAMQRALEQVHVAASIGRYMRRHRARQPRELQRLQVGASPRGTLALVKLARCRGRAATAATSSRPTT